MGDARIGDERSVHPNEARTPTPALSPTPSPGSATFAVDLPIAAGDSANAAYGIWPFGVHGSSHALDGHPGFDVEFRPGAPVRAAADGTVLNVVPDINGNGRFSIRIAHRAGGRDYATDYTNIGPVASGIAAGVAVLRGQVIGAAGVQNQIVGTTPATWGMTHFQVNDFSRSEGLTNPNAVSPEAYLSPEGRSLFESIWRTAVYWTEFCEPFATNSRLAGFPFSRSWALQSGSPPARLDVRCVSEASVDYDYTLRGADGSAVETGIFNVNPLAKPFSTIDLRPSSGPSRLGVYDIVGDTMQLNLAAAGAPRPTSLGGASTYTTRCVHTPRPLPQPLPGRERQNG